MSIITGRSRQKLTLIKVVEVSDYLVSINKIDLWLGSQVKEPPDDSTTTPKGHVFIFSLSKYINKTGVHIFNDTIYIENSFSDHPTTRSRAEQNFTAFPLELPNKLSP